MSFRQQAWRYRTGNEFWCQGQPRCFIERLKNAGVRATKKAWFVVPRILACINVPKICYSRCGRCVCHSYGGGTPAFSKRSDAECWSLHNCMNTEVQHFISHTMPSFIARPQYYSIFMRIRLCDTHCLLNWNLHKHKCLRSHNGESVLSAGRALNILKIQFTQGLSSSQKSWTLIVTPFMACLWILIIAMSKWLTWSSKRAIKWASCCFGFSLFRLNSFHIRSL